MRHRYIPWQGFPLLSYLFPCLMTCRRGSNCDRTGALAVRRHSSEDYSSIKALLRTTRILFNRFFLIRIYLCLRQFLLRWPHLSRIQYLKITHRIRWDKVLRRMFSWVALGVGWKIIKI